MEAKNEDKVRAAKARAAALSPAKRRTIARTAAAARWKKPIAKATHGSQEHPLIIGDIEIACYVLEDGRRVISQRGMQTGIGMSTSGSTRGAQRLALFIAGLAKKGLDCNDLSARIREPLLFQPLIGGRSAYGYEATILTDICDAVLEARKTGLLLPQQAHFAKKCEILVRGFSRVGIIALVDEATGYQEVRQRDELRQILSAYISSELLPWTERFPMEFFREMFRLWGWRFDPADYKKQGPRGPRYAGKLIRQLIYDRLPPGVLDELETRNPPNSKWQRKNKLFQHLTEDIGNPHLEKLVTTITTLFTVSPDKATFWDLERRRFAKEKGQLDLGIKE